MALRVLHPHADQLVLPPFARLQDTNIVRPHVEGAALQLCGGAVIDTFELDQKASVVVPRALDGKKLAPNTDQYGAGLEAPRVVGDRGDIELAGEPVRLSRPSRQQQLGRVPRLTVLNRPPRP